MGVLFVGHDLAMPSHLWMRRMLAGLGQEVRVLATVGPVPEAAAEAGEILLLREELTSGGRVRRKLSQWRTRCWNGHRLSEALTREDVTCCLVHFITEAVKNQRVWANTEKPVFVHCHGWDCTWSMHEGPRDPLGRLFHRSYVKRVLDLSNSCQFIANSAITEKALLEIGIPAEKIMKKPLGVPVSPEFPKRPLNRDPVRFLFLGRMVDLKGPDLTLRAFEAASEAGMNGILVMAGGGPMEEECRAFVQNSPVGSRIEIVGEVSASKGVDLREWADVFTAHSQRGPKSGQVEAFGVAFVEAMAAGLPVVTGASGNIPEVVRDQTDGLLFDPGDVKAHSEKLKELARYAKKRRSLGYSGWLRARSMFSIETEICRLRAILNLE